MPSVRAVWLARREQHPIRESAERFNALGAGGVARAMLLVAPVAVLATGFNALGAGGVTGRDLNPDHRYDVRKKAFQCPRCGRCGSRGWLIICE